METELSEGEKVRVVGALSGDDHRHEWRKLPDSVGLFACGTRCVLPVLGRLMSRYGRVMA